MTGNARSAVMAVSVCLSIVSSTLVVADDRGLMITGGAYYAQLDQDRGILFNDTDRSFTVGMGWRFNRWFAVDVGYWDLGKYTSDEFGGGYHVDVDVDAWTLGGIASLPVGIFNLYLRAGFARWEADSREVDDDGSDPFYGLGFAVTAVEDFEIYSEWIRFDLGADIDTLGLGLRYTF